MSHFIMKSVTFCNKVFLLKNCVAVRNVFLTNCVLRSNSDCNSFQMRLLEMIISDKQVDHSSTKISVKLKKPFCRKFFEKTFKNLQIETCGKNLDRLMFKKSFAFSLNELINFESIWF